MDLINDKLPNRNLPNEAEQWGRSMEQGSKALAKNAVQLQQQVNNMGRATSGQLAVISAQLNELFLQVTDLSGRVSYSSEQSAFRDHSTTSTTWVAFPNTGVKLTLTETRTVRVGMYATLTAISNVLGAVGYANMEIRINGSAPTTAFALGTVYQGVPSVYTNRASATASGLITLGPGTYDIVPGIYASGDVTAVASNGVLIVDVLQRGS